MNILSKMKILGVINGHLGPSATRANYQALNNYHIQRGYTQLRFICYLPLRDFESCIPTYTCHQNTSLPINLMLHKS